MKYIKTDTNIFEVVQETELVYRVIGVSRNDKLIYTKSKCQTKVLGESDILEDLFDDIVIDDKRWGKGDNITYRRHFLANCLHDQREYQAMWPDHKKDIKLDKEGLIAHLTIFQNPVYGGIWTDKGFKYVAKMNPDGEFELIPTLKN